MAFTPFFPQWRAQLAALRRRASHSVRQLDWLALSESFRDLLPPPLLDSPDEGPGSRERIYSLRLTLQCFVWQMLKPRTACREVVRAVQGLFQSQGWGLVDERASPYIQARQRLPEDRLVQALQITAQVADRRVGEQGCLHGRPVKVADSSTVPLPDTLENQALYPQAPGQKPGCGFPLLKFLPIFSLSSGAISQVVTADWKNHDARLLHQAWDMFQKGDVLLVGPSQTTSCWPPCRHGEWMWWRGCTERARWTFVGPNNVWVLGTHSWSCAKGISNPTS